MRSFKLAGLVVCLVVFMATTADARQCFYRGELYSDGAANELGQICDGVTGSWRVR
jgi:hypothetical protein